MTRCAYLDELSGRLAADGCEPQICDWARPRPRGRKPKQINEFGCMARPVTIDAISGAMSQFRGSGVLDGVYAAHLRRKGALYFPEARQMAAGSAS